MPFVLGAVLALRALPAARAARRAASPSFALFMGVSMSVTAFPVLARILTDRRLRKTPLGVIALACAAVDDVTAWCLLAFVVGVVERTAPSVVLTLGADGVGYIAAMLLRRAPARATRLGRACERARAELPQDVLRRRASWRCSLSALRTEAIGIHALFGAFLLGAIVPHDSGARAASSPTGSKTSWSCCCCRPSSRSPACAPQIGLLERRRATGSMLRRSSSSSPRSASSAAALVAARLTGLGWRDAARARRADEHARPDGADRAQHRPRPRRHLVERERQVVDVKGLDIDAARRRQLGSVDGKNRDLHSPSGCR